MTTKTIEASKETLKKDLEKLKTVQSKKDFLKDTAKENTKEVRKESGKDSGKEVNPSKNKSHKRESSRYFRPPEILEGLTEQRPPQIRVKIRDNSASPSPSLDTVVSFEDYGKYLAAKTRTPTPEEAQEAAERYIRVKQLMKEQELQDAKRKTVSPQIDSCIFQGKPSSALSLFDNMKKLAKAFKKSL